MGAKASKPKILVVDDDRAIRTLMVTGLADAGFAVTAAADGDEALGILARRRFDLVILDLRMPRLDGYEVLARLRGIRSRAETPVLVVTATGSDRAGMIREAGAGVVGRLTKPFTLSDLERAVRSALSESIEERRSRRERQARAAELYRSIIDLQAGAESPECVEQRRPRRSRLLRSR